MASGPGRFRVLVRGLPFQASKPEIRAFFSEASLEAQSVEFPDKTRPWGKGIEDVSRSGMAFVGFKNSTDAIKAVENRDRAWFRQSRRVRVLEVAEFTKRELLDPLERVPHDITMQGERDAAARRELGRRERDIREQAKRQQIRMG